VDWTAPGIVSEIIKRLAHLHFLCNLQKHLSSRDAERQLLWLVAPESNSVLSNLALCPLAIQPKYIP
jgi:hypothetical protein